MSGKANEVGSEERFAVQARIAEIMRAGAERAEVTVEQVVRDYFLARPSSRNAAALL
jgi:hypothetical protein